MDPNRSSKEQNYRNALLRIIRIQEDCGESYEELIEAAQVARAVLGGFDHESAHETKAEHGTCETHGLYRIVEPTCPVCGARDAEKTNEPRTYKEELQAQAREDNLCEHGIPRRFCTALHGSKS